MAVAHLAFQLGARHQRRYRVDGDHVEGRRAHQRFGDLQRLFGRVRLGDEQVVDIYPHLARVRRVQCVLGVDDRAGAAQALSFGDHVLNQRRLAGRLGAEDFGDSAAGHAADPQGDVQGNRTGGDGIDRHALLGLAQLHDRAFAELFFDVRDGVFQRCLDVLLIDNVLKCLRPVFPGDDLVHGGG